MAARRAAATEVAQEHGRFLRHRPRLETSLLSYDVQSMYRANLPAGGDPFLLHVLPDGAVDLVWVPGHGLGVMGPDRRFRTVALPSDFRMWAIRFRPGRASRLLGLPITSLTDIQVPLGDLWGPAADRLTDQMESATSERAALALLRAELLARLSRAQSPDRLVHTAVEWLQHVPKARVSDLGDRYGISDRQLRRRFLSEVGYGPKTHQRIARLERFFALSRQDERGIADVASEAGFVDQAHLTNDCARLTGYTPTAVLRLIASAGTRA